MFGGSGAKHVFCVMRFRFRFRVTKQDHSADEMTPSPSPGNDLHDAAIDGSVRRAKKILLSGSIDINEGDPDGWTPLMCAAKRVPHASRGYF